MDKLPPSARSFLDSVAECDSPTPAERVRADAFVRDALSRHGLRDLPPLVPQASVSAKAGMAVGSKLLWGAFSVAIIGALALGVTRLKRTAPEPAAPAHVSPPSAAPASQALPPPPKPLAASVETPSPTRARERMQRQRPSLPDVPARPANVESAEDGLQRELRIIASANELLRRQQWRETLQLLDGSERGASPLQEERTALRILAWCGQGPDSRALRERDRFLRTTPEAVLAARVRAACERDEAAP